MVEIKAASNNSGAIHMTENKKILVAGAGGQLAASVLAEWPNKNTIALSREAMDVSDAISCTQALEKHAPDIVINCAAWTAVDDAQNNEESAFAANAEGAKTIARWCADNSAYLVHISTDYVFSGSKPLFQPYIETDFPNPVSVYGRSKLLGEVHIRAELPEHHAILRTAWLYGSTGKNFLKTLLRLVLIDPYKKYQVVDDQYGSPTSTDALARQIRAVVENQTRGLYHASAQGYCSWYQLACEFFALLGLDHRLEPCTTEQFPTLAVRPQNAILDNRALQAIGLDGFVSWQDELRYFVENYGESLLKETKAGIKGRV